VLQTSLARQKPLHSLPVVLLSVNQYGMLPSVGVSLKLLREQEMLCSVASLTRV